MINIDVSVNTSDILLGVTKRGLAMIWKRALRSANYGNGSQDIATVDTCQLQRFSHGGGDGKSPLIP